MRKSFIVAGLALAVLVIACGNGDDDTPKPITPTPAQRNQGNVNRVCDYFHARAIETLAAPGAKATVTDLVNQPGIPDKLRASALIYFESTDKNAAYASVIKRCQSEGWSP